MTDISEAYSTEARMPRIEVLWFLAVVLLDLAILSGVFFTGVYDRDDLGGSFWFHNGIGIIAGLLMRTT